MKRGRRKKLQGFCPSNLITLLIFKHFLVPLNSRFFQPVVKRYALYCMKSEKRGVRRIHKKHPYNHLHITRRNELIIKILSLSLLSSILRTNFLNRCWLTKKKFFRFVDFVREIIDMCRECDVIFLSRLGSCSRPYFSLHLTMIFHYSIFIHDSKLNIAQLLLSSEVNK